MGMDHFESERAVGECPNRRRDVADGPLRWAVLIACCVLAHGMLPADAAAASSPTLVNHRPNRQDDLQKRYALRPRFDGLGSPSHLRQPTSHHVRWASWSVVSVRSPATDPPGEDPQPSLKKKPAQKPAFEVTKNWLRLAKEHEVWIDTKQKKVMVGGYVCLRAGQLEMFACPKHTKEHESVVAVNTPARFVHVALLAVGAQEGEPVQYDPKYRAAQGVEVNVEVIWKDKNGKQKQCKAQEWVKSLKTGSAMKTPWVFVGSAFWKDETDGQRYYIADGGEFICVSNFSTAMLDLPVKSSQANEQLMFTAFTENIPPRGTPIQLILTPKIPVKAKESVKAEDSHEATKPGKS